METNKLTKEEKDLLIKDLSARLPYGVMIELRFFSEDNMDYVSPLSCEDIHDFIMNDNVYIKPYLRSIEDMTSEEVKEYGDLWCLGKGFEQLDWLNKHHVAYRTLDGKDMFELGLAIRVTEENNPYKDKD